MSGQKNGHDLGDLANVVLQRRGRVQGSPKITLLDVYNLLCKGGTKYVRRQDPDIRPETIALARAFLIASRPDLYDNHIARDQSGEMNLLVDECITARIIPMIRSGFGKATHTNFAGLNGCGKSGIGDGPVWEWAVNRNYDAIVTRDRAEKKPGIDLTRIAKDHALSMIARMVDAGHEIIELTDLPVIVQIQSKRTDYRYLSGLFNKHREGIIRHLETRAAPVVIVNEKSVMPQITYKTLWAQYLEKREAHKIPQRGPVRERRWLEEWTRRIDKEKPDMSPERRKEVLRMLQDAAQLCAVEIGENDDGQQGRFVGRNQLGVPRTGIYLP